MGNEPSPALEPNIVTIVTVQPAFLGVVDKRRKGYRIMELKPDCLVGLHKAFLADAVLVFSPDKMALVADLTTAYPDYKCTE
jgi:hypothetical protein